MEVWDGLSGGYEVERIDTYCTVLGLCSSLYTLEIDADVASHFHINEPLLIPNAHVSERLLI
jgi:hypothetical protein